MMIETQAREITNEDFVAALHLAHSEAVKLIPPQLRLASKVENQKRPVQVIKVDESILEIVRGLAEAPIQEVVGDPSYGKFERGKALGKVQDDVQNILKEEGKDDAVRLLPLAFDLVKKQVMRRNVFENSLRVDGRTLDDVRELYCESGIYPALHGSSLFSRGNTQVLCTVTIGSPEEAQKLDSLVGSPRKRFMVHYSFPPFSINEVGKVGGLNRREVGHGTLAEKALLALLPPEDDEFPYSVRVTSEVLASDGSSSMATVCGGSMALMDAGIPLKEHVAGVSIGLMTDVDASSGVIKDYRILTDILGLEDHLGDMDFKIAGTRKGITAIQLDIKLPGVPLHILCEGLEPARKARIHILEAMEQEISKPRDNQRENTPHRGSMAIQRDSIGRLIGPQGANVKNIQRVTGARLTVTDEGTVIIMAKDRATFDQAKDMVESSIGKDIEVGGTYTGTVMAIKDFGAFIEFDGGQQGLLHISEISHQHVASVADFVSIGQKLPVICIGRDFRGNLKFSHKATFPPSENTREVISSLQVSSSITSSTKLSSNESANISKDEKEVSISDVQLVNEVIGVSEKNVSLVVASSIESVSSSKSQEVELTRSIEDSSVCVVVRDGNSSNLKPQLKSDECHLPDERKQSEDRAAEVDNSSNLKPQLKSDACHLPDEREQSEDRAAEVGTEYTVTVKQVRLYGAVVQMNDGALGALRLDKEIKDGKGPKLEVGDHIIVECTRIGSKGRPSFVFKRAS
ncbi:hypothetical protein O6H91_Y067800 [Diphasiastrum complanatum]|nr:hypothetical protein O6H91_Y067800 [Diphasiastrum complanatum]